MALVYAGVAIGVALAMPVDGRVPAAGIPEAQTQLDVFPARVLAIAGNILGTLAVVGVALRSLRRRPLGNALILAGVAVAALGSALAGPGESGRPPPRRGRGCAAVRRLRRAHATRLTPCYPPAVP